MVCGMWYVGCIGVTFDNNLLSSPMDCKIVVSVKANKVGSTHCIWLINAEIPPSKPKHRRRNIKIIEGAHNVKYQIPVTK